MSKSSELIKLVNAVNVPYFKTIKHMEETEDISCFIDDNKRYAVRSSANVEDGVTCSFAGVFDTFLCVSPANLKKSIKRVLNFRKLKRFADYSEFHNIDADSVQMEVIVQEMIFCDKSGITFELSNDRSDKEIFIESAWGLGEYCVSGMGDVDKIICNESGKIEYNIGCQTHFLTIANDKVEKLKVDVLNQCRPKLTDVEVEEILRAFKTIKKIIPYELEFEWGFSNEKLWIFQVRPITVKLTREAISKRRQSS